MFRKIAITVIAITALLASIVTPALAAPNSQVTVTIPTFTVTLNEQRFDENSYEQYPFLVYKGITYFPMTYYLSNLMNLNTSWTAENGLVITKGNPDTPKTFKREEPTSRRNNGTQTATIAISKITINGKQIDNNNESYPLLVFRDITYLPMTWAYAVDEFGWSYSYSNEEGLNIKTDNFYYTPIEQNDNTINDDGSYTSVYSESVYIKGDLVVTLKTDFQRLLGPKPRNLSIVKNGAHIVPDGYFGYFNGQTPLFSVDNGMIITSYYTDPDERVPTPCMVSIETGEIQ